MSRYNFFLKCLSQHHKNSINPTLPKHQLTTGTEVSMTLSTSEGWYLEYKFPSGDAFLSDVKFKANITEGQGEDNLKIVSANVISNKRLNFHPYGVVWCIQTNMSQDALLNPDNHSNLPSLSFLCCHSFQRQYLSFYSKMKMKAGVWQNVQYDAKHFMS